MDREIKTKALEAVQDIQSRCISARNLHVNDFNALKKAKYITDRTLVEYFECLPLLQKNLKREMEVLDIGCGQGIAAAEIAKQFHCKVTGTIVENPNKKTHIDGIKVINAAASSLPFSENTFDIVTSIHGISWEPNQKKALNEVVRVLKKGGTAHIYLIKFSHSIALFYGKHFWNGINHDKYLKYEFSPIMQLKNAQLTVNELDFPNEICEGYHKEWQLFIRKTGGEPPQLKNEDC